MFTDDEAKTRNKMCRDRLSIPIDHTLGWHQDDSCFVGVAYLRLPNFIGGREVEHVFRLGKLKDSEQEVNPDYIQDHHMENVREYPTEEGDILMMQTRYPSVCGSYLPSQQSYHQAYPKGLDNVVNPPTCRWTAQMHYLFQG